MNNTQVQAFYENAVPKFATWRQIENTAYFSLTGNDNRKARQFLMFLLTNKNTPIAKSGIHAVLNELKTRYNNLKEAADE